MIKAVLFDLDGTLLNTNELIYMSFKHTYNEILNMYPSEEEIKSNYGKPLEVTLGQYVKSEEELNRVVNEYRSFNQMHHDNMCKPFMGALELLKELKNLGIKTAIVTSKRKELATRGLTLGKMLDYIDVIVSPEDTEKHKPDAEPAIKACELLNVEPKEAIMVGDSSYDLICGKKAGCLTCGVEYTALDINVLLEVNPTYMVKEPLEILNIIK